MDLSGAVKAAGTSLPPPLPSDGCGPCLLGHRVPRVPHVSLCNERPCVLLFRSLMSLREGQLKRTVWDGATDQRSPSLSPPPPLRHLATVNHG